MTQSSCDELRCARDMAYIAAGVEIRRQLPAATYTGVLGVECPYARRHFEAAFRRRPWWRMVDAANAPPADAGLLIGEYEMVDWDKVMGPPHLTTNNFCVRKGLSRKANFGNIMSRHAARFPACALASALPATAVIDTMPVFHSRPHWMDLASALSEALLDADEAMTAAAEAAAATTPAGSAPPPLWILKPSLGNKGAEVCLVETVEQVTAFLKAWRDVGQWVLQRYVERPLLLRSRKFHVRLYVLVNAAMEVHVFRESLLLFAVNKYNRADPADTHAHITNTCVNAEHADFAEDEYVRRLSDLPHMLCARAAEAEEAVAAGGLDGKAVSGAGPVVGKRGAGAVLGAASSGADAAALAMAVRRTAGVYARMCEVVAECFLALERETSVYMPLESSFELYGADFLLEEEEEAMPLCACGADGACCGITDGAAASGRSGAAACCVASRSPGEGKRFDSAVCCCGAAAGCAEPARSCGASSGCGGAGICRCSIGIPRVRVLEFNPTPDIKQSGSRLDFMIGALIEGTVKACVDTRFPPPARVECAPAAAAQADATAALSTAPLSEAKPRAVMRQAPLQQLYRDYIASWDAAAASVSKSSSTAAAEEFSQREALLKWDKVLSLPPPAAAVGGGMGMRCF